MKLFILLVIFPAFFYFAFSFEYISRGVIFPPYIDPRFHLLTAFVYAFVITDLNYILATKVISSMFSLVVLIFVVPHQGITDQNVGYPRAIFLVLVMYFFGLALRYAVSWLGKKLSNGKLRK